MSKRAQNDRATGIHFTRGGSTKFHPNGTVQDNVDIGKVLDPAVGLLEAEDLRLFRISFPVVSDSTRQKPINLLNDSTDSEISS